MSDTALKIDDLTLLKLTRLNALMRACDAEFRLTQTEFKALLDKLDPEGQLLKLDEKMNALRQERLQADAEYNALIDAKGKELGISMAEYTCDAKTGVLTKNEPPPAQPAPTP